MRKSSRLTVPAKGALPPVLTQAPPEAVFVQRRGRRSTTMLQVEAAARLSASSSISGIALPQPSNTTLCTTAPSQAVFCCPETRSALSDSARIAASEPGQRACGAIRGIIRLPGSGSRRYDAPTNLTPPECLVGGRPQGGRFRLCTDELVFRASEGTSAARIRNSGIIGSEGAKAEIGR